MKLNACDKHKLANEKLLTILIAKGWIVDRYGHAKKEINGTQYRYKFQSHSVRKEIKVEHSATKYSPKSFSWVRTNSLRYK